jgi:hypothetical protein
MLPVPYVELFKNIEIVNCVSETESVSFLREYGGKARTDMGMLHIAILIDWTHLVSNGSI